MDKFLKHSQGKYNKANENLRHQHVHIKLFGYQRLWVHTTIPIRILLCNSSCFNYKQGTHFYSNNRKDAELYSELDLPRETNNKYELYILKLKYDKTHLEE